MDLSFLRLVGSKLLTLSQLSLELEHRPCSPQQQESISGWTNIDVLGQPSVQPHTYFLSPFAAEESWTLERDNQMSMARRMAHFEDALDTHSATNNTLKTSGEPSASILSGNLLKHEDTVQQPTHEGRSALDSLQALNPKPTCAQTVAGSLPEPSAIALSENSSSRTIPDDTSTNDAELVSRSSTSSATRTRGIRIADAYKCRSCDKTFSIRRDLK